jgi:putative transposase
VAQLCREWDVSIRRACGVLEFDTSTYHYKAHRRDQAGIEARIKDICETRVRYGYRRVHVLLRREGHDINEKRTRRIYSELGMQLRNKTPKRRVTAKLREDRQEAIGPNDVWAMDFVHDQLATVTKLRILTVVDTFSRYVPVLDPRFNYRAENVVIALDKACSRIGYPRTIRVDNVLYQ